MTIDMKISGNSTLPAGEYNEVKISGSGKLAGTVRCNEFSCSGAAKGQGDILCKGEVKTSGALKAEGSVSGSSIKVSGAMSVDSASAEGDFKVSGALDAKDVRAKELKISGVVKCGTIEAERAKISGIVECGGLLNADTIEIDLGSARSRVGAMGGSRVVVLADKGHRVHVLPIFSSIAGGRRGTLEVDDAIEADDIAIENVIAKRVTGRVVAVGAGCEIELVQYTGSCEIHPDARVGTAEQI